MSFSIGTFLGAGVYILALPILTRIFMPDAFGKAGMFILLVNFLGLLLTLGFDQVFIREYDFKKENIWVFKECLNPSIVITIISVIGIGLLYKEVSLFLFSRVDKFSIIILIFSIILTVLNRFSLQLIRMKQLGYLYSIIIFFQKSLEVLTSIAMSKWLMNTSYVILIFSYMITNFIMLIIGIFSQREVWLRDFKLVSYIKFKHHFEYGVPIMVAALISWIFQSMDKVMLRYYLGTEAVGIYTAGFKIVGVLTIIQSAFVSYWTPLTFEKYRTDKNCKTFFINMNKIVTLGMSLMLIVAYLGRNYLILILGSSYRTTGELLPYLLIVPVAYTISETTVIGINFMKRSKFHIWIAMVVSTFNILGNCLLIPKFSVKGAAISTAISYIIFLILRTEIAEKVYSIRHDKRYKLIIPMILLLFLINDFS